MLNYSERGIYTKLTDFKINQLEDSVKKVLAENYKRYWREDISSEKIVRDTYLKVKEILSTKQQNRSQ